MTDFAKRATTVVTPETIPLLCPRCGERRQSIHVGWTETKAWCMKGHVMFKQKFPDPRGAKDDQAHDANS